MTPLPWPNRTLSSPQNPLLPAESAARSLSIPFQSNCAGFSLPLRPSLDLLGQQLVRQVLSVAKAAALALAPGKDGSYS